MPVFGCQLTFGRNKHGWLLNVALVVRECHFPHTVATRLTFAVEIIGNRPLLAIADVFEQLGFGKV